MPTLAGLRKTRVRLLKERAWQERAREEGVPTPFPAFHPSDTELARFRNSQDRRSSLAALCSVQTHVRWWNPGLPKPQRAQESASSSLACSGPANGVLSGNFQTSVAPRRLTDLRALWASRPESRLRRQGPTLPSHSTHGGYRQGARPSTVGSASLRARRWASDQEARPGAWGTGPRRPRPRRWD